MLLYPTTFLLSPELKLESHNWLTGFIFTHWLIIFPCLTHSVRKAQYLILYQTMLTIQILLSLSLR